MNTLLLISAMLLPGPDYEIPKQNLYILVDTKSKDWYTMRRSLKVRELAIDDARFFPSQLYYLRSRHNIEIQEFEDRQRDKYKSIPSFRFGKNGEWEEFCPGTFAADGMFTISLYYIARWEQFEEDLGIFATLNWKPIQYGYQVPIIPNYFPNDFIKFYHKEKTLRNLPFGYSNRNNNIFVEQFEFNKNKIESKGLINDIE